MSLRKLVYLAAHVAILLCVHHSSANAQDPTFERHIRPILRQHCFDCHGATDTKEGNLDLRLVRFMKQGGDSGAAINSEKPSESLLIQRVVSGEMPPGEAHMPAEQLAILKKWVEAGAKTDRPEPEQIGPGVPITAEDRDYWAFRPITRPAVPEITSTATSEQADRI
ncbi:MAG: c-type cytochrome domain-containing protein, partial [Pirellula sp.]